MDAQAEGPGNSILFVDLDGTLISSDLLWETLARAIKARPWVALWVPLWLLRGRAGFKQAVARSGTLDPHTLPYRGDVLEYVRDRRKAGTRVVLATASPKPWADEVARHLDLFDDVLASTPTHNLKGVRKREAIEAFCRDAGAQSWAYIGDSPADLPIWQHAGSVHVVAPSSRLLARVHRLRAEVEVHGRRPSMVRAAIRAMRPHQWVKNSLLFVPLLLARQFMDPDKTLAALAAFVSFSLCASSVYIVNDLLDLEADRAHPKKCRRPFASGALPLLAGPPLALASVTLGFVGAIVLLPLPFVGVLALYMAVTSAYSTMLKRQPLVDILVLASLYTLRVFAGGVATELRVSEWLLAFSIFMFTSLAFAKRYVEMSRLLSEGKRSAKGRGYEVGDISLIESFGTSSGYIAILVFALYVNNGLPSFYTHTSMLWLSCPLMLFWISRLWFLAKRGQLHDDPVVFAVTDAVSLVIGAMVACLTLLAAPFW